MEKNRDRHIKSSGFDPLSDGRPLESSRNGDGTVRLVL